MKKTTLSGSLPKQNFLSRIMSVSWLRKSLFVEILSLWFVILFLYTGIAKLLEFDVFQEQLADSPVLQPVAPVVAWGLPLIEFIVSILLFFPKYRLKGLYASFSLMALFTVYIIILLNTSAELPCSCGGIIEQLSWQGHLIFNSILTLLAFLAIRIQKHL
ncbi:MAG: MauE/DoxX family redox-associated membrane protein [Chitinophagaceae bacterium]